MRKTGFFLLLLFIPLLSFAQQKYDFTALDSLLSQNREEIGGEGFNLLIFKDGEEVYNKSYGEFSEYTEVPVASASKWFAAALLMKLADEGKLSLDDRVVKYLPEFHDRKGKITIRQLLCHTSGLPFRRMMNTALTNRSQSLQECADEISRMMPIADAGTKFFYGGTSFQLAGRIAEIAGGATWDELFKEKIAKPLGLTDTHYDHPSSEFTNPLIAGGLLSNAEDYSHFLLMILNKGMYKSRRVLSEKAVETMLTDQTRNAAIAESPYMPYRASFNEGKDVRYGIGCWLEQMDAATGKAKVAASPGLYGFTPWIDVDHNIAAILAVKSEFGKVMPVSIKIREAVEKVLK